MVDLKDKKELHRAGMEALEKALGPVGALEFLGFFNYNNGDYTKEKYERPEPSIEEIREAIKVSRDKAEAM